MKKEETKPSKILGLSIIFNAVYANTYLLENRYNL